ncbi:MAG: hypothetical protein KC417_01425, partial [Myxococcales bacterium]|nr:hypothetical protein [Myxococcales bacterium]
AEPSAVLWPAMQAGTLAAARQARPAPVESAAFPYLGSDEAEQAVESAVHNAERAGCNAEMRFECMDAAYRSYGDGGGFVVTNPPWGQRMDAYDLSVFRERLGDRFRRLGKNWRVAVVEPSRKHAEQLLGACEEVVRLRWGGISAGVFLRGAGR